MIIQELIIVSLFAFEIFNLKVLRNGTSYNQLDIIGKGVKKNGCFQSFLKLGLRHLSMNFEECDLVFQIQCSQLEEKIQSSTEEKELFYYRGV